MTRLTPPPSLSIALATALAAWPGLPAPAETGTTIIGTQEAPTVLNVVPWQTIELRPSEWGGPLGQTRSVLDDSLQPIDRAVMQRETDYFYRLSEAAAAAQAEQDGQIQGEANSAGVTEP